ncbi:transglutaminase-like domain-containing protein [Dokdonella sp.]|uniref:transglutaminase-like domain-containing protein n=1 Tax=Dokdonella sp. TaxID=2291710 RepID=UPI0025C7227A|nr:transglutaminase-like domain-containing protein [Dokdonella sp.]MBX3692630.1 lasso peptide biosynthesis protein [Dokdonella sp.]MCW5567373.1 lasso peptide biosynthesis protein [Dokdonella sp.]
MLRAILAFLFVVPGLAIARGPVATEVQWYTVLLDGRKVGQFENHREVRDALVVTTQAMRFELDRAGTRVTLSSVDTSEETLDGKPLAFTSETSMGGSEMKVNGRIQGGRMNVRIANAGASDERELDWPRGALLPEGQRLALLDAPLDEGATFRLLAFQAATLEAVEMTSIVGRSEMVALPGGRQRLTRVEQVTAFPGVQVRSTTWVDASREMRKLTVPTLGVELTLLACDEACATAPNQSTDVLARTLVRSPRPLRREELAGGLRYRLKPQTNGGRISLPDTSEQRVHSDGRHVIVEVRRDARHETAPAQPGDYAANDWLQSAAPEIVELAHRGAGDAHGDLDRMRNLEAFVRGFITRKTLGVGYASALEVARNPEGDCTEHAVLLAALGRALGIATRVVDGLAYAPDFAGAGHVFVPHAWVQAWVDGRWQGFDAALAGFDAGHIAFSSGDGDPLRFYQSLDLLGRLKLVRVETLDDGKRR